MAKVSRAAARLSCTSTSAGSSARRRASAAVPAAPGGRRASMRDSRPPAPSHSCAWAMSVSTMPSRPAAPAPSVPARCARWRTPPTSSSKDCPGARCSCVAAPALSATAPSPVNQSTGSAPAMRRCRIHRLPVPHWPSGPRRSAPACGRRGWRSRPPPVRSAAPRRPRTAGSRRRRTYSCSSMPPGPPVSWCVAAPLTACSDSSNAFWALAVAMSTATIVPTPSARPTSARASCAGWRSRWRTVAARRMRIRQRPGRAPASCS